MANVKVPGVRSSAVMWDGSIPLVVSSGRQAWGTSAVSNLGGIVVPFRAYVSKFWVRPIVAATSAAALINIGTQAAADGIVANLSMENVAAGFYEYDQDDDFVSAAARIVDAGSVFLFEMEAASAVGTIAMGALLVPAEHAGV